MKSKIEFCCLIWLVASVAAHGSVAAPTQSFTISASNITMPANGEGLISFTLTSVHGFAGALRAECTPPIPPIGIREPVCGGGPVSPPITLAANATAT
jgi:hypothetical protein